MRERALRGRVDMNCGDERKRRRGEEWRRHMERGREREMERDREKEGEDDKLVKKVREEWRER